MRAKNKTKQKDKGKGEKRVEEMMEVGSWQRWRLQSFPPQTIKEE